MSNWQIGFLVVTAVAGLVVGIRYWSGPDCRDPKGMYGPTGQFTLFSCLAVAGIVATSHGLWWGLGAAFVLMIAQGVLGALLRRS